MKENLNKIVNKVKELWGKAKETLKKIDLSKIKAFLSKAKDAFKNLFGNIGKLCANVGEKLKKIDFLRKVAALAGRYRFVLALIFFCASILALILVATLGWNEFVVPVCLLIIIEVLMAVLLHRSELWIHGILLVAQVVVGVVIDRLPLVVLCVIAYIVATITLQIAFKKPESNVEAKTEPKKQVEEKKEEVKEEKTEEKVEDKVEEKVEEKAKEPKKETKKGKKNK